MDALLVLKLVTTPLFVVGATLVGRRWGPAVSGLLVGLPLTTGPISYFLCSERGSAFAVQSAVAGLGGQAAVFAFCLTYARLARTRSWATALGTGALAFGAVAVVVAEARWDLLSAVLFLGVALGFSLRTLSAPQTTDETGPPPWWELPLRVLITTALVVAITALANRLGAQRTGILSTFPIYSAIFATFTHTTRGGRASAQILAGVLLGSVGYGAFFVVVVVFLGAWGPNLTYSVAALAAVAAGYSAFWLSRHRVALAPTTIG
jgi:hypothetical protein